MVEKVLQEKISLKIGDKAPDFKLVAQDGKRIQLSNFLGKKNVLLIFFPQAFTPVCTTQLPTYSKRIKDFEKLHTQLLAIGIASVPVHQAWIETFENSLNFPLLADWPPNGFGKVSKNYNCFIDRLGFSKRATFLIDKNGIIRYIGLPKELNEPIEDGPLDSDIIIKEINKL